MGGATSPIQKKWIFEAANGDVPHEVILTPWSAAPTVNQA
jgi:hypothetical protein